MKRQAKRLKLVIKHGVIKSVYDDALLALFDDAGWTRTKRASHVEPTDTGQAWFARIVGGPLLGAFKTRQMALEAERAYINQHIIK